MPHTAGMIYLVPVFLRHLVQQVLDLQVDQAVIQVDVCPKSFQITLTYCYCILRAGEREREREGVKASDRELVSVTE